MACLGASLADRISFPLLAEANRKALACPPRGEGGLVAGRRNRRTSAVRKGRLRASLPRCGISGFGAFSRFACLGDQSSNEPGAGDVLAAPTWPTAEEALVNFVRHS
jgi:hypothetical protein